jgi:AAA ATPase domain
MGQVVQDPPRRTLAARLEDRDRGRFAGRDRELEFLDRCMDSEDPPASVVHISGPGGIGKSALLREVARRARARGFQVIACDGREYGPAPGVIEAALRDAANQVRPLVILDSYERMAALDPYLRRELLPSLPDRSLVVIAGRGHPDTGWFTGGWESVTASLDLTVLKPREARDLLATHGLSDERVPAIIEWAEGSPLALALAADAATADPAWNAAAHPDRPEILRSLVHRLIDADLHDVRPSALGIAALARTTTPQLLRAVLPDEDAQSAYQQLSELTVSEPLGDGIALHDLVRKALLADLRRRNPELERDLRRRIIDYLYQCASDGQQMLVIEMAHLVENPVLRWGFGWEGSARLRIDSIRDDDADRVERQLGAHNNWEWWQLTRRYFAESPDRVAVARDLDDRICGYMAYMSQATAPPLADTDPLIGRWLAHARLDAGLGDSVLWQAAVDFTGQGKVQAMLGLAGVLRSGVANPRFCYLPIDPSHPGAVDFAQALNATHLTELDADIGGQRVECHRLDCGPGGLLASLRRQVYLELGLPEPDLAERPGTAGDEASPAPGALHLAVPYQRPGADLETVRMALRNFRVPRDLARSPLAQGDTVPERAEFVRRQLRTAAQEAFGDSASEQLLQRVLMAGYLEPTTSHEAAAARLCLSRAAYFRRLRTAVERLAEHMTAPS